MGKQRLQPRSRGRWFGKSQLDILEDFAMIEADFQREYGMNLVRSLDQGLSWRRFLVLLGHLGPNSVTTYTLANTEDTIEDEDKAADFLEGW